MSSWRWLAKIPGSGSVSQRYGSADPDPYQNIMDPQHWSERIGLTSMMHGRMLVSENSYWKWPTFWRLSVQATRPDSSSSSRTAVAFSSSPGSTCPQRIQEMINNRQKRNGIAWTPLCLRNRNRNLSKVGTGTIKNSYGSAQHCFEQSSTIVIKRDFT